MVEFALVLPLLVILGAAIVQFGIAYNRQITIQQAAREGARALALDPENEANAISVAEAAAGSIDTTATADGSACDSDSGVRFAQVDITTEVEFGIPFVVALTTIELDATARMRCGL
jgi:Flp pilus assembly protein TadG